jgi:PPM family protein phosphatase
VRFTTSLHLERGNPEMQDRAEIFAFDDRIVIAVADGAGGTSGGAQAAETFIYNVKEACAHVATPDHCRQLLLQIDSLLAGGRGGGETTGIIAVVTSETLFGALVGDSDARLYCDDEIKYVSGSRPTKPLLGSGSAFVSEFATAMRGMLVVATDGLWKYARSGDIADKVLSVPPRAWHQNWLTCLAYEPAVCRTMWPLSLVD